MQDVTVDTQGTPENIDEHNPSGKTFFGHPFSLANLFCVEMWERFSFYGMQGILLIYMYYTAERGGLGIEQSVAAGIVGAYGGTVYLACILGGWIADRLLGPERMMFYAAILIMCGHISLALIPGVLGLAVGLVCIALGSGCLKTSATTLVGSLYAIGDTRRDAGFSVFYMGINVGALFGPLLTGLAQAQGPDFFRTLGLTSLGNPGAGFHAGFGLAAVFMALGLIQYAMNRKHLPDTVRVIPNPLPRAHRLRAILIGLAGIALIALAFITGIVTTENLAPTVIVVTALAAVALFAVILTSSKIDSTERSRIYSFIPMFIGSAAFWALYQQQFTVVTIYSDKRLDRHIPFLDLVMPVSWVQSINAVFIILLAPLFAMLWTKLGKRQPNTPLKFGLGIILMGSAFVLFLPMVGVTGVPVLWIVLILGVATLGELCLSPVGMSLASKLAPKAFPVMMVALFYLSVALGTALSGYLAEFYSAENEGAYFGVLGAITIGIGVVMLAISRPVHRAMRGID
ncbi:peptide MFS transporter [Devriesea agamarum]|uniref:peptide MFS transporter n=1 Tax=Devriesea agamarum TaxID=472569 RepID=UPI00071D91B0|nr:oligopeptide:H+ symporter [Devriesea agamarum]